VSSAPRDHAPDEFIPTRNSLLSRLRDWDDHESWRVVQSLHTGLGQDSFPRMHAINFRLTGAP